MKVYLVGGAVRNRVMGLPEKDRDWCVVGATPRAMLEAGFMRVGKDFPVFLHPESKEQYALARTRAAAGAGRGVACDPAATIEDDLSHRDFTMNALAVDEDGAFIDPFGGLADIRAKLVRHVGPTFGEDPVRALRAARFCAQYPDFTLAPETRALLRDMAGRGELDDLQPERVWGELVTALSAARPTRFFDVLRVCGALKAAFPDIDALFGVPQVESYHPEIDTGVHTMMVLDQATGISASPVVRFAALVHDLGKAATPAEELPHHHGHGERGAEIIKRMVARLRGPNLYRNLGVLAARWHGHVHRAEELRPGTMLKLFRAAGAFHRPDRMAALLDVCLADARGRKGHEDQPYPEADILRRALEAARAVTADQLLDAGQEPSPKLWQMLRQKRIEAIKRALGR